MDEDLADQVAGIAARVVASGAISANGHGNVSILATAEHTLGPRPADH
jgi:hypothetical protein